VRGAACRPSPKSRTVNHASAADPSLRILPGVAIVHAAVHSNPLIVQGDLTVLVDVDTPRYPAARDALARFAELIKSPEHIHTCKISPLSIWNACAAGTTDVEIVGALAEYARFPLPSHVAA